MARAAVIGLALTGLAPVCPDAAPDDPEERPRSLSSPTIAEISITTDKAVPLYKDIHSACVADIFAARRNAPRDILAEPYFSRVKALGFNSLHYSGGSTSDHDHVIVGDTRVQGGAGDGYNIRESDARQRGEDFQRILQGIATVRFGKDFFNEYCAFLDKLGIHGDIIANVQVGTLEELLWKLERARARRVVFGMEQNLEGNAHVFPTAKDYRDKVVPWIEAVKERFPDVVTAIDAAPVWRTTPRFAEWNKALGDMPGDEARLYLWDKDLLRYGPDPQANMAAIHEVFQTTLPRWIADFRSKFPGKKMSVWQWGVHRRAGGDVSGSMLACLYIAKFYRWMIDYNAAHDNFIGYASFMSLKSLDRGDGPLLNHYHALKLCGMLFAGDQRVVGCAVSGAPGVEAMACESNGRFTLLLINETSDAVRFDTVTVDGAAVKDRAFRRDAIYGKALNSRTVLFDKSEAPAIVLKPYSVTVVQF